MQKPYAKAKLLIYAISGININGFHEFGYCKCFVIFFKITNIWNSLPDDIMLWTLLLYHQCILSKLDKHRFIQELNITGKLELWEPKAEWRFFIQLVTVIQNDSKQGR